MSKGSTERTARIVIAILVALFFIAVVTVNALANILPLNGVGTGTLSDEIPNLFVPAGLTFSVWGLIYALLTLYAVVILAQALSKKANLDAWQPKDGIIFLLNAAANVAWIFSWHWRMVPLSILFMAVIFGTLLVLEERNFKRYGQGEAFSPGSGVHGFVRFALTAPINVYLGWICVATIANLTAVFVKASWSGFGLDPVAWTVIVIIAGLAVALGLIFRRNALAAPLVVVWAYAGIVIKRTAVDANETRLVWISALVAVILILGALGFKVARRLASGKQRS